MESYKIPERECFKHWHRLLWSTDPKNLNLKQDKIYIIHQVLAWGEPEDLDLLYKVYGKKTIRQTFIQYPKRVYTPKALKFVQLLLGVTVEEKRYVSRVIDVSVGKA